METVLIILFVIASIVTFVVMTMLTVLVCLKCRDVMKRRSRSRGQFPSRNHRRRIQVEMAGGGHFTIDDTLFDPPPPYSEVNNNRSPPPPYTQGGYATPVAVHRGLYTRPIARLVRMTRIQAQTGTQTANTGRGQGRGFVSTNGADNRSVTDNTRIQTRTETPAIQTSTTSQVQGRGFANTTIGAGNTAVLPDSARMEAQDTITPTTCSGPGQGRSSVTTVGVDDSTVTDNAIQTQGRTTVTHMGSTGRRPARGLVSTTIGLGDTAAPDSARTCTVTSVELV